MSSVNLIQSSEPRPQPPQGGPARAGDPFGELLESTSAQRPEPAPRHRQAETRQEPAAPRSRGETRRQALHQADKGGAARAPNADRPAGHGASGDAQAGRPAATDGNEAPGGTTHPDFTEPSSAPSDGAQGQTAGTTASGETDEAVAGAGPEIESGSEFASAPADEDGAPADDAHAHAGGELDASAPGGTETPVTAAADAPPAMPAAAPVEADAGEIPAAGPVAQETSVATPDDEAPLAAPDGEAADENGTPAQAAVSPAPATAQHADAESTAPAPVQPAAARSAGPAGESPQAQPTAQGNAAPQTEADGAAMQSDGGTDDQLAQKQPDTAAAQAKAQDAKPQDARPQAQSAAPQAEAAKPAASTAETAPAQPQPDTLPEPVRALAATLHPANVNSITFRSVALNERAPVPLNGTALAAEIVSRMRDGMRRFDIRLDPPELGRVDVRLEVDRNGNVKTRLTVDRPETLDLMQREARGLERALQQAGLKTDSGGLEFSLRSHADQGHADGRPERGGREPHGFAEDGGERIEAVIEGYRSAALARGGVDIRI